MVILGKIEKMFKTLFASGFSGVKFNFISFVASICTIVLFVWGFVKIIFVPIKSSITVKRFYKKGTDDISKGNLDAGREYLKQVIDYPSKLGTQKVRCYARLNYAQSFSADESTPLDDLKKAEVEYSRIEEFLSQKSAVYNFFFRYTTSVSVLMSANRVDLYNKLYKYTQNDSLLLTALLYGETAINALKDEQLLALVKSTTATTYRILAEKLNNVDYLKKSILYSEDALTFYEGQNDAEEIIRIHNNLGNAYALLCFEFTACNKEDFSKNYQTAHFHFSQAIDKCPYTVYPEAYARNYMNLSVLIYKYICSMPEKNSACLCEAKEYLAKALEVYTPEVFPFEYACCKMNLLLITSYQGIMSKDEKLIRKAIADGEDALSIFTSQKYPAYNMKLHQHLGYTYDFLANVVSNNTKSFVDCCKKAIEHLEFIALEQSSPIPVLKIISKLITLSADILQTEHISDEDRLKYSCALNKYNQKMSEIRSDYPDAFEVFSQELPHIPDDAEIIHFFEE